MTREPTGRVAPARAKRVVLTLTREFRAPIEDVWASVTESDRLARWIGTWTGDPTSGPCRVHDDRSGRRAPSRTTWRSASACHPPAAPG